MQCLFYKALGRLPNQKLANIPVVVYNFIINMKKTAVQKDINASPSHWRSVCGYSAEKLSTDLSTG
jgi:hypothetical protein